MPIGIYERTEAYRQLMKEKSGPITRARHDKVRQDKLSYINGTGLLRCTKCKEEKDISFYQKDSKRWSGVRASCKSCNKDRQNSSMKKWYANNKEKVYWQRKKWTHGISKEDYIVMVASQNGVCAICNKSPRTFLKIDHNHETNDIRGLLCEKCNSGIGLLGDSITVCRNAAKYLEDRGSYGKA